MSEGTLYTRQAKCKTSGGTNFRGNIVHFDPTAVHLHDSGPASARSCARIQLDPRLAGCMMTSTVHVCGPIGNGLGSEARLVARVHTLIIRLPTPYELFGSSHNTVRLSTRPRTGCLNRLPGPV